MKQHDHGQGTWFDDLVIMAFWLVVAIGVATGLCALVFLAGLD